MTLDGIEGYSIQCGCHTYVTLMWNDKFVACYDNDTHYMEEIIDAIEKRTRTKIADIQVLGSIDDFNGLRFNGKGFLGGREWLNEAQVVRPA